MTGKQWIESFLESLFECRDMANLDVYNEKDSKWTEFMVENAIKKGMEKKTYCNVVCIISGDPAIKKDSGEYLNIDAMFFNNSDYHKPVYLKVKNKTKYDPRVLPSAVVEHENGGSSDDKIAHCLWKLLCIRSQLRVLICYWDNIDSIRKFLEDTIIEGGLAEGLVGELFVVIGDRLKDQVPWNTYTDIKNYFSEEEVNFMLKEMTETIKKSRIKFPDENYLIVVFIPLPTISNPRQYVIEGYKANCAGASDKLQSVDFVFN